eukprot:4237063-Pyramimonas_sp.AAC.1
MQEIVTPEARRDPRRCDARRLPPLKKAAWGPGRRSLRLRGRRRSLCWVGGPGIGRRKRLQQS